MRKLASRSTANGLTGKRAVTQAVLTIDDLPQSGILASTAFVRDHLAAARRWLERADKQALAIVLPVAGPDHDDWRRTLARDLARAYAPIRVNVVGASGVEQAAPLLAYLRDAPGVTGQYLAAHE